MLFVLGILLADKTQSSHRITVFLLGHTNSQWEESGESQFQGSLWRATLSRAGEVDRQVVSSPGWGLSTESDFDFASPPPDGGNKAGAKQSGGDGGGGRGIDRSIEESTTRTDPSRTERPLISKILSCKILWECT